MIEFKIEKEKGRVDFKDFYRVVVTSNKYLFKQDNRNLLDLDELQEFPNIDDIICYDYSNYSCIGNSDYIGFYTHKKSKLLQIEKYIEKISNKIKEIQEVEESLKKIEESYQPLK